MSEEYDIALAAFEEIRRAFPQLVVSLDRAPHYVDLEMTIPQQPGLAFDVHLNLQNRDELHLAAGPFCCEWFPCSKPERARAFVDVVIGLIASRYRILVHRRGDRAVKAQLQRPDDDGYWSTVATWATVSVPWPSKRFDVLQNFATV